MQSSYKGLHRTNSQDHVRRLVEKEGRAARNLVTWSVPVSDERQGTVYISKNLLRTV